MATVQMSYPPSFVVDYAKKLKAAAEKGRNNGPAEIAMLTDIVTMLGIAQGVMTPEPTHPDDGNK